MAMPLPGRIRASVPAAMTVAMQGLNSLSNLMITWFLVRRIGVDGFGYYSTYFILTVNTVAICGGLVINPLNSVASKGSARRQAEFIQAARVSQAAVIGLLLLICGGALAVVWTLHRSAAPVIAVAAYVTAMSCGEFWRRIRFFRGRVYEVFGFDMVRYAFLAVLLIGLSRIIVQPGPTAYTLAIAASYPLAITAGAIVAHKEQPVAFERRRLLAQVRRLLRSGKWLAIGAFLKFAVDGAVLFLSFIVLGPYQAGVLRLAQTIVSLTTPAVQALEHTVPRHLGQKSRQLGKPGALREYRLLAALLLAGFVVIYLVIVAFAPFAIRKMGVDHPTEAVWLVAGFCGAYFLTVLLNLIEFALRAEERAHIVTLALVISACLVAVLAYPAMLSFGSVGAVCTILIARFVSVAVCGGVAFRERNSTQ